jgi:GT2 family glycosyltransferase
VSFVLYRTEGAEIRTAVDQVLDTPGRHHVVLVDNSVPGLDLGAYRDPRITIIRPGANIGYGAGHNLALRRFEGRVRYHFVLNTDLTFGPSAIAEMIAFMDAHPEAGLAMPLVRYPDGALQHLCRILPRPIDIFGRAFFSRQGWTQSLTRRYESHDWAYDAPLSFPFLSGCFMVLRPETLAQSGLFDERFFLFAEDLDLSRRLHRISQTLLCPNVTVRHEYRTKSEGSWARKRYLIRSFVSYFNKYGWIVDRERESMNRRALQQVREAIAAGS